MASAKNTSKKKTNHQERPAWFNEVVGIVMIGTGILLLLALISYTPNDMPIMGLEFGPNSEASSPRENSIGVVGALLGFSLLFLLGAASYLLPVGLIWLGLAYAFLDSKLTWRTLIGFLCFLITGACLLNVQTWLLWGWAESMYIKNPGGVTGQFIGTNVFEALLNKTGAILVLLLGYFVGMIMVTGLNPIHFAKVSYGRFVEWRETARSSRKKREAKEQEKKERRDDRDRRKLEREEAKLETKRELEQERSIKAEDLKKKKEAEKIAEQRESEAKPQTELPLRETPKPQIIDSSQRKKPSAPLKDKPFDKKQDESVSLSADGFEGYDLPGFDLLEYDENEEPEEGADKDELMANQKVIVETLKAFGVDVTAGDITCGPTITRYEVYPSLGLRVNRITQLEADLARATKAERINILAPIPGKDTVGIEIANDKRVAVPLRELLQDESFTSAKKKIPLALGKDVYGNTVIGDLAAMPHLLVAGATGAGKSVCINSIITSILYKFSPDELRFIMVDPKVVEMQIYGKLPHLVVPVVTDPAKVVAALRWVVNEMEKRYSIFAKCGVRNFDGFNSRPRPEKEEVEPEEEDVPETVEESEPDPDHIESIARAFEDGELGPMEDPDELDFDAEEEIPDKIPYIVIIIDELADLMQTAPADVEMNIARIAQKARAAGIHLIIATQTPRADVVTGIIKANIPSRIAFQVSSSLDSRVILDTKGAEKLVGKGDMLYLPPGSAKLERSQGAFVSDEEVEAIVAHCSNQTQQHFESAVQESIEKAGSNDGESNTLSDADEEVLAKCITVIQQEQKASTSLLQRRLRLGYTRAARMMDILEEKGYIGPGDGAKAREILIPGD